MSTSYWMVVGSPENFQIARDLGFSLFGFKSTRRREAAMIKPGDKLIFYLTGIMKLAGTATITSEYFEDHTPIWRSEKKAGEDYPFRVHIEPEIILDAADYLDARDVGPRLAYTKKWPPQHWRLAFQGNLHQLPQEDYDLIVSEMKQVGARAG